jgi:hypothetical protein
LSPLQRWDAGLKCPYNDSLLLEMNIHQLSVNYVIEQDRILVQANTLAGEVLSAWLTRRLTVNLHPRMEQLATDVELKNGQLSAPDEVSRKIMMDFKKEEARLQGDFKTPFSQKASQFPIGQEPLLVTKVNFSILGKGALRVEFEEILPNQTTKRTFQITLAGDLLHGFMHLFENAVKSSAWGLIELPQPAPADDAFPHAGGKPVPPTYLN